jgi:hypothetical protein
MPEGSGSRHVRVKYGGRLLSVLGTLITVLYIEYTHRGFAACWLVPTADRVARIASRDRACNRFALTVKKSSWVCHALTH